MELLEEAGMPPGVINMVTGHGVNVSPVVLTSPDLAGIHFTGSTALFQSLWQQVGTNLKKYKTYPRLVGETSGQGLHPGSTLRRPGCVANGHDSRRVRVSGPEVFSGLTRLCATQSVEGHQG